MKDGFNPDDFDDNEVDWEKFWEDVNIGYLVEFTSFSYQTNGPKYFEPKKVVTTAPILSELLKSPLVGLVQSATIVFNLKEYRKRYQGENVEFLDEKMLTKLSMKALINYFT